MQTKKILVIEDDSDAAEVLEAYLLRECFLVNIAADGYQGLRQFALWKPDLILLDMMLRVSAVMRCFRQSDARATSP